MLDRIKFNYVQDKFKGENGNIIYKDIRFEYDEFQEWVRENESEIIKDICTRINNIVGEKHTPTIHLVYLGNSSKKNFMRALELSVWGFPEIKVNNKKTENKFNNISNIKTGDIILFIQGWTSSDPKNKTGLLTLDKYVGELGEVTAVIVNRGFYEEYTRLWDDEDEVFPYRVNFDKQILFNSKNVPCNKQSLGYLYNLIYDSYTNKIVNQIDIISMLKLLNIKNGVDKIVNYYE